MHSLARERHESTRDRASRDGMFFHRLEKRVQGLAVTTRRHPGGDRLQRMGVHRVSGRGPSTARKRRLTLGASHPKTRPLHLTTPERNPARGAPTSPCPPIRLMPAVRTARRFPVRLQHRQKNLSTGPDTKLVKRLSRIENDAEQGQRHVDRYRLPVPGLDSTPVTTASVCFATFLKSSSTPYGTSPRPPSNGVMRLSQGGRKIRTWRGRHHGEPQRPAGPGSRPPGR